MASQVQLLKARLRLKGSPSGEQKSFGERMGAAGWSAVQDVAGLRSVTVLDNSLNTVKF